jgi:hypothetical protein
MTYTDEHVWMTYAAGCSAVYGHGTTSCAAFADNMLIEHRKRFPLPVTPQARRWSKGEIAQMLGAKPAKT